MTDVLAVVGPTASGKTSLAIELALRLGTEIVSADSMQFYRHMEIGTAAPIPEELARVKHHFIGFLDPDQSFSAGKFGERAREVVAALNGQGKPAVVVGGSGLYVNSLIDDLFSGPAGDEDIRERLQEEAEQNGPAALYERLRDIDPKYAGIVHPNDLKRVVRGLEVYELTGKPITDLHEEHQQQKPPFNALLVAIDFPRDLLYDRVNKRVDLMVEQGFLDEVRFLLDNGYGPHIDRLRSLGYREIATHLRGECSLEEALDLMKMYTRRYAKRQLTWYRGDDRIHWIKADPDKTPADYAATVFTLHPDLQPTSQ